jgi:putative transposase
VDAQVKAGLLALVEYAKAEAGWSLRKAADTLGLDHVRVLRWQVRAGLQRLDDARPGPDVAAHALLDWEREAIVKLAEEWGEVDLSHTTSRSCATPTPAPWTPAYHPAHQNLS